jgi:uncharacterized repeat protein (TIGR01451 family)
MFSCMQLQRNYRFWLESAPCRLLLICGVLLGVLLSGEAASAASQPDIMVRLSSEDDATYVGRGVYESAARIQSKAQASFGGSISEFKFQLVNAGDTPDSYLIKGSQGGSGFNVEYLDETGTDRSVAFAGAGWATGIMAPGASLVMTVRVTPTVLTVGASYRVSITASSTGDQSKVDQAKSETVVCGSAVAVIVSVPPDLSGAPGSVIYYPYTVTNVGSSADTYRLAASSVAGWSATIIADDGAGGGIAQDGIRQSGETRVAATTGPIQPGSSYRFFVAVAIPEGSRDGSHADTRLAVTGHSAATSDLVTTTALAATLSVAENVRNLSQGGAFAPAANAYPGDVLEYRMTVTNSGQRDASDVRIDTPLPPNLSFLPGTAWIGASSEGAGPPCPAAECGTARESAGSILARLGTGATAAAGGALPPGKTLHVFFRVKVE